MCGSHSGYNGVIGGSQSGLGIFLGEGCQVYPLGQSFRAAPWMKKGVEDFKKVLPGLEGYCAYTFFAAGAEIAQVWAGASEEYINEVILVLKSLVPWRELGWRKFRFHSLFWEAMSGLVEQGCVSQEKRPIKDKYTEEVTEVDVYYPTEKLLAKMSTV